MELAYRKLMGSCHRRYSVICIKCCSTIAEYENSEKQEVSYQIRAPYFIVTLWKAGSGKSEAFPNETSCWFSHTHCDLMFLGFHHTIETRFSERDLLTNLHGLGLWLGM